MTACRAGSAFIPLDVPRSAPRSKLQHEIFEYPVVKGAILPSSLLPLNDMINRSPKIDFDKLADYVGNAQKLLREQGLL